MYPGPGPCFYIYFLITINFPKNSPKSMKHFLLWKNSDMLRKCVEWGKFEKDCAQEILLQPTNKRPSQKIEVSRFQVSLALSLSWKFPFLCDIQLNLNGIAPWSLTWFIYNCLLKAFWQRDLLELENLNCFFWKQRKFLKSNSWTDSR